MKAADWAPEGEVKTWKGWKLDDIPPGAFVICRNNAPLISIGFKLLARGVPITVQGGEISKSLINFILRIGNKDPSMSAGLFYANLDKWLSSELVEAEARRSPSRAERATDKADMCRALPGKTVGDLVNALKAIFSQTDGIITLMSGHKSKGLEADTVIHLSPHLIPSRFAQTDRAKLQEQNLQYVIETRPKLCLVKANFDLLED